MITRTTTETSNRESVRTTTATYNQADVNLDGGAESLCMETKVESVEKLLINRKHWYFIDNFGDTDEVGCMRTNVTLSLHQKKRNVSSALDKAGVRVVLKEEGKQDMHYFMCMLEGCFREGKEGTVAKLDKSGGASNGSSHLKNCHEAESERTKKMKKNSDECCKA